MAAEHELSPGARQRMAALLPDLLVAVRTRRRRRHARRAAVALLVAALPILAWQLAPASAPDRALPSVVDVPRWVVVHDDPAILARCEVPSRARSEWLLTDDDLQAELRAADRPAGLVRTRNQVLVSAAAVDRWPGESP